MSFWIWQLFRRWFRGWMRFLRLPGECFARWSRRLGLTRKVSFRTTCRQRRCLLVSLGFDWLEARTAPALTYRLIADINPGAGASQPQNLTNVSGTVFFVAMDGTNSWHLWRSDGTSSGTFLVRQIGSGAFTSRPRYLTNVNGTLFFVANDGTGDKIWRSNGDAASTQRLDSLTTGLSAPRFLANLNNTLFFTANSPTYGRELFRSNANFTAATLVADINSGTASSNPSFLFPFGNKLLFAANDGTSGTELWAHDTVSSQTFRVLDINPGSGHSYPAEFAEVDGVVYFSAIQAGLGRELWKTDGSSANTSLVADIYPGPGDSQPRSLTNLNGRLAFSANTPSVGRELFLFDPATGTPQLVKDIHPTASSVPRSLTNVNGTLFFAANDGQHGYELWQSDLTAAGTILAIDFAQPGNGLGLGDTPGQLVNANGMLFLGANNGSTGLELWLAYEPASVQSVSPPPSGTYGLGSTLTFSIRFSRPVLVSGTPILRFTCDTGSDVQSRDAVYTAGSASDTLTFSYTVQAGDNAPSGITVTSPIQLPTGASITDTAGNSVSLSFTDTTLPNVKLDGVAPTITSVSGPAAGTYIVGQNLDFTVVFSEAVAVTGAPRLVLTIGSTTQYATYLSGSGSNMLLFRYTVQVGDLDSDGIAVASPIDLNGGTIKDTNGNDAVLTFTAPNTSGVLVDGVAPTITSVSGPTAGTYIVGQHLDFTVVFSEAVAVTGTPRLVLTIGSTTRYATYLSGTGTSTLTFRYTVQSGDLDSDGIAVASPVDLNGGTIKDVPGNDAVLSFMPPDTSGVLVDGVAPTITSVTGPAAGTYIVGQNLDFTVVFSDGGGSYRHAAAATDHRQHDSIRHVSERHGHEHTDLPLHGAIGRPGHRWHCRRFLDWPQRRHHHRRSGQQRGADFHAAGYQ
jgi:ELWxxDGT repeat protein